jgi:hypothetical protein
MRASIFHPRGEGQRGQSTVEMLIATAILAVAVQASVLVIRTASKLNVSNRDRAFATEKAMQMLEELRGLVLDEVADIGALDGFADGRGPGPEFRPNYKYTLSTKEDVTKPQGIAQEDRLSARHSLSANPIRNSGYVFVRHVDIVKPLDKDGKVVDENLRKIYVRVYEAAPNGGMTEPDPAAPKDPRSAPLAEVFGVVRSLGTANQPSQVIDLHLVALENVPGWWSRTSNLIPLMQSSLVSLQARNPGLKIRPHWIRRLSFGRDPEYTPELNQAVRADANGAFKKAYIYPGLIRYDDADDYYYLVDWFKARINVDGFIRQNEGYALADQFNHAVRYPDEERLYQIIKTIAANRNDPEPEMSLRMLLEKMNSNAPEVRNAIVINLHGEMVPVVPLRNVSDAAKDPLAYTNRGGGLPDRAWRAVSHPERLGYSTTVSGQQDQAIRVYAYDMAPPPDPISVANEDDIIDLVTVFIPGATLDNLKQVERIQGNSRQPYYKHVRDSGSWLSSGGGSLLHDGLGPAGSTWVADELSVPGRSSGLRIRLYGVTPTARAYYGPAYVQ